MTEALTTLEAIRELMPENAALIALSTLIVKAKFDRNELTVTVAADNIVEAARAVQLAGYNFFEDCTAVDWYPSEPRFQMSYHIVSMKRKERVRLAALLDGDDPVIPSITSVWPSANFYEREVFDLFGIRFSGHPNLTRIMMPTDWKGHPLRKDYPVEGYR
jgi:NADH-quinone oxidoreductase subunit C